MTSPHVGMPVAGDTIAQRFCVLEPLGQGSWSVVFHAIDIHTQNPVALKILRPQAYKSKAMVERFRREAMFARRLSHPNTVRLYDHGQTEHGLLYIAMEHLSGNTLAEELRRIGPLGVERSLALLAQICKGLAAIHTLGLVHRDLKPDNIFLCDNTTSTLEEDVVKILDFGISRPHASAIEGGTIAALEGLTEAGQLLGTPLYMSPEQIQEEELTPATDIYALGHIFYEMLTGRAAFDDGRDDPLSIIVRHLDTHELVVPLALRTHPVTPILQRAVAHSPAARFPNARTMLKNLQEVFPDTCPASLSIADPSFTSLPTHHRDAHKKHTQTTLSLPSWIPQHDALCDTLQHILDAETAMYVNLSGDGRLAQRVILEHLHQYLNTRNTACVCIEAERAFSSFSIEDWFALFHASSPNQTPDNVGEWFGIHLQTLPKHVLPTHTQSLSHLSPEILRAQAHDHSVRVREKICASAHGALLVCIIHDATYLDPDSQHTLTEAVLFAHANNIPLIVVSSSSTDTPTRLHIPSYAATTPHAQETLQEIRVEKPNDREAADFLISKHPHLRNTLHTLQDLVSFQGHTLDYIEEFAVFLQNLLNLSPSSSGTLYEPFHDTLPNLILQHLEALYPKAEAQHRPIRALLQALALLGGQATRASVENILAHHVPPIPSRNLDKIWQDAAYTGWIQPSQDSSAFRLRTPFLTSALLHRMVEDAQPDLHTQSIAAVHTLLHNTPYPSVRVLHHITELLQHANSPWERCHIQTEAANHAFHQLKFRTARAWYSAVDQVTTHLAATTFPEYLHRSKRSARSSIEIVPKMRLGLLHFLLEGDNTKALEEIEICLGTLQIEQPSRFVYNIRARCLQIASDLCPADDIEKRTAYALDALEHFEQLSNTNSIAQTQLNLALLQSLQSAPHLHEDSMDETFGALVLAEHIRSPVLQALAHQQLAIFHILRGSHTQALHESQQAMVLFAQTPFPSLFEQARVCAITAHLFLGQHQHAFSLLNAAAHTQRWVSPNDLYPRFLRLQTHTYTAQGLWDKADASLREELRIHAFNKDEAASLEVELLLSDLNLFTASTTLQETQELWNTLSARANAIRPDLSDALRIRSEILGLSTILPQDASSTQRSLWASWHHGHPLPESLHSPKTDTQHSPLLALLHLSKSPQPNLLHTVLHKALTSREPQRAVFISLGALLRKSPDLFSPTAVLLHKDLLWRLPGQLS